MAWMYGVGTVVYAWVSEALTQQQQQQPNTPSLRRVTY